MSTDPTTATDRTPTLARTAVWLVPGLMWLYYLTALIAPRATPDPVKTVLLLVPPLAGCGLLIVRRRFPVGVPLLMGVLLFLSPAPIGAALVAQATVARRVDRLAVVVLSAAWLCTAKMLALLVGPLSAPWGQASAVEGTIAIGGVVIATLVGRLADSQAAELRSRADSDRARHEAEIARLDRARLAERERIAREMHDVLAHRLSLVAMHAGVLAYRTDLTPEETHTTAQVIQRNTQQSLDELRAVLSTLRGADAPPEPPQPTLAELPVLLADSDHHQDVDLTLDLDPATVPVVISRHAYRIAQESLTNARKHAPGAPVRMTVTGLPGGTLEVRVSNPLTDLVRSDAAGPGFGLLGVSERAASVGGTARHGVTDNHFVVEAELPWREDP